MRANVDKCNLGRRKSHRNHSNLQEFYGTCTVGTLGMDRLLVVTFDWIFVKPKV